MGHWDFSVVGQDAGQLKVRLLKHAAERAKGKDMPPPLPMKRVR